MRIKVAGVVLAIVLAGCGGSTGSGDVDWSKYPPQLRTIIEQDTAARNCDGSQAAFDMWSNAHDPGRGERYSHTAVMQYIDSKLESAGCYG